MNAYIKNCNKQKGWGFVLSLLLGFLYLSVFWRYGSFTSMILCLLTLLVAFLCSHNTPKNTMQKNEKLFALSLLLFFLSALASFLIGSGYELKSVRNPNMPSLIDIDLPSKYLIGALLFVLFFKLKFTLQKSIIFYSIALGGIVCGIFAAYQRYFLGMGRVQGMSGIAEFADESAILCILSIIIFSFLAKRRQKPLFALSIFSSSFALLSTGTRGALLGIILAVLAFLSLVWIYQRGLFKKALLASLFCAIGLICVLSFSGGIKDALRVKSAISDIEYYDKGDADTSIGARFEMWKEAVAMFKMAPFFGLSTYEILQNLKEIRERSGSQFFRDQMSDTQKEARGNKHNQILNTLAKRGIVGAFALLFVWFAYAKLFYGFLKVGDSQIFAFSLCALLIGFYYLFPNSLTGDVWESNVSVPLIILSICCFYKLILQEMSVIQERECA